MFYIFFQSIMVGKSQKAEQRLQNGEIVWKGKKENNRLDFERTLKELVYITQIHELGEKDESFDQEIQISS